MWEYKHDNYIQHHGILGMKWGVRRFQNADGTRTNAGKKRERVHIKKQITDKRQLESDTKTLNKLYSGARASRGLTEKRQAQLDARDKAFLENRIEQTGKKMDSKWSAKNSNKITNEAKKKVMGELDAYSKELINQPGGRNSDGKISAKTINAYNNRMSQLMSSQVSDIRTPSGKSVSFVAKRGEIGVFMALSTQGYNISQFKNGIYGSGKVAYRSKVVDKMSVSGKGD